MPRNQRTVRREADVTGVGLHSGTRTTLRVRPAPPGAGVTFVRTDLPGRPRVPATVDHHVFRRRRTTLVGSGDAQVNTVEHFLACCLAMQVDNLEVDLDGEECPGMDGSAQAFAEMLEAAEPVDQPVARPEVRIAAPLAATGEEGSSLVAVPAAEGLRVSYTLEYEHPWLRRQAWSMTVDPDTFVREVAPARTFCLESEAAMLRAADLGKGATYENTLVVGEDGVLENELRWPDEFARHKTLDLLGDLFLLGADLHAQVNAYRTGHAANVGLVREIRRAAARSSAPARRSPVMSQSQVRRILPHRYPFLLVDRVLELEGFQRAVGLKNVTINEPFFTGHYPDEPIMPGVLVVEAMAQLAGILLLRKLELTGKIPVLLSIDRVKFRRAVVPGDQLRLEAETIRLSGSRGRVQCRASVEEALVSEARLNFALTEAASA